MNRLFVIILLILLSEAQTVSAWTDDFSSDTLNDYYAGDISPYSISDGVLRYIPGETASSIWYDEDVFGSGRYHWSVQQDPGELNHQNFIFGATGKCPTSGPGCPYAYYGIDDYENPINGFILEYKDPNLGTIQLGNFYPETYTGDYSLDVDWDITTGDITVYLDSKPIISATDQHLSSPGYTGILHWGYQKGYEIDRWSYDPNPGQITIPTPTPEPTPALTLRADQRGT